MNLRPCYYFEFKCELCLLTHTVDTEEHEPLLHISVPAHLKVDNGSWLMKHYAGGYRTAVQHWEDRYTDMLHL